MSDDAKKRDAIERTAAKLVQTSGGQMTHTQAQARVAAAVARGDRQRENNNR